MFKINKKEKSTDVNEDCKKIDYTLSALTFLIIFTGFFMNIFLLIKYGQNYDPLIQAFIIQNYTFMIFNACGLLFYQAFYGIFKNISNEGLGNVAFLTILCSFAVAISQLIIIRLTFISISNIDLLLFFASAGISEESLFRMGIQLSLELIFIKVIFKKPKYCNVKIGKKNIEHLYSTIFAIFISSFIFGLYHLFVKQSVSLMLAVFVSSIVLGIFLRISKRIDVCLLSHVIVNLIVAYVTYIMI